MKKIVITGANGTIGTVLRNGLNEYHLTSLVRPQIDVRNIHYVSRAIQGQDVIVHLAWDTKLDNMGSECINPDNSEMFHNIYKSAVEQRVKRVIMASSVHADNFYNWKDPELLSSNRIPVPDTPYGAHKVFMESLGRYYATRGLEVVCIRFGAVNKQNKPHPTDIWERKVFFDHADCIGLIDAIISAARIPNNFAIVYGISDNKGRIHDISNPFGWKPTKGA